jgi:hypothetical protein
MRRPKATGPDVTVDDAETRGRGMTDDIRLGAGRPVRRRPSLWSTA